MKYFLLLLCISLLIICNISGQIIHEINVNIPEPKFYSNYLKLGGSNSKGDKISVNNYFLSLNDRPFIPITGEFHFSRYANQYWDESIKKIKAGGINTIATYVFWNIHEEKENVFNWKADNDLRRFVELCAKNNLFVIVRVGPFCHGEIRNGGLPDWIMGKALEIRSNDPGYLFYVERLFKNIGEQLKGLYFKDGGPIIGIQLENEYQHSAAPWGLTYPGQPLDFTAAERDLPVTQEGVGVARGNNPYSELGNNHMSVLKALAVRAGMDVPIYTDFGELLAPMVTVLPKDTDKITPENINDLRYAVRVNKNSGFVFLNNFQDDTITTDKTDIQF
jgi:beta-galactosidase